MKIYFIGQKGIPSHGGGVERHVDELATRMATSGHKIFVYARKGYTKKTSKKHKGVNMIYTRAIYTKHLEAISHTFFSILNLIGKEVDVIHFQSIGPSLLIPLARLIKPNAKIVSTIHCSDYHHQKWGWFARLSLRIGERMAAVFPAEVITVSEGLRQHVKHAYNKTANYVPNGVSIPELGSNPKLLNEWGLKPQEYIVSVSRLIKHKGVHFLIEAYQSIDTDKKLVIVGDSGYTDKYVAELRKLAADNPNIIFTGTQTGKKLQALFEHAYLFVHPSLAEGLSIALLEALGYNQVILASDIPENLEVIGDLALTFKSGNVSDLASNLEFLIDHPQITNQYRSGGRDYVEGKYNWDSIAEQTLSLYEKVTENVAEGVTQPSLKKSLKQIS